MPRGVLRAISLSVVKQVNRKDREKQWLFLRIPLLLLFVCPGWTCCQSASALLPRHWAVDRGSRRSPGWPSVNVPQPGTDIPFQSCPLQAPDLGAH